MLKSFFENNKTYWYATYFLHKYEMHNSDLKSARNHGLPYIERDGRYYYCESDFHDYYSGRIGD